MENTDGEERQSVPGVLHTGVAYERCLFVSIYIYVLFKVYMDLRKLYFEWTNNGKSTRLNVMNMNELYNYTRTRHLGKRP